eukprot:scaffold1.g5546.t1
MEKAGPVLRVQDGGQAVLCTDQESIDGGCSRESSVCEPVVAGARAGLLPSLTAVHEDWIGGSAVAAACGSGAGRLASPASYPLLDGADTAEGESEEEEEEGEGDEVEEGYEGVGGGGSTSSDELEVVDGAGDTGARGAGARSCLALVVFVRDGVAIRPTRSNRILGRLSLIKQHGVLFLAWLPYAPAPLAGAGDGADRSEEVKAVHTHAPPLGSQVATITLYNGVSLPPLHFQHGGLKLFLSALRQHAHLVRSTDPQTYLLNDTADPLQRSLHSLELTDVLLGGPAHGASAMFAPPTGEHLPCRPAQHSAAAARPALPRPLANWHQAEGEVPLRVQLADLVDRLQRFTANARDTASSFFSQSMLVGAAAAWGGEDDDVESGSANSGGGAAAGERASPTAGPAPGAEERRRSSLEATTEVGVFELIERGGGAPAPGGRGAAPRPPPVTAEELATFFDTEGRLVHEAAFRQRVFDGGLEPEARPDAWRFLLGVCLPASTTAERARARATGARRYAELLAQWRSIDAAQAARFAKWRERRTCVEKDVRRTDRAQRLYARERSQGHAMLRNVLLSYCMHNFDLGYVQGMSDLLSPILYVMRSAYPDGHLSPGQQEEVEANAFWAFAALMDRMESNFSKDGHGMQERDCMSLFFLYRWVLILWKREFEFGEVLRLWEALWACPATRHLHLYMCVAVLEHQRRRILGSPGLEFDDLLKLCVELAGRMDLGACLRNALLLCQYAGEAGAETAAVDPSPLLAVQPSGTEPVAITAANAAAAEAVSAEVAAIAAEKAASREQSRKGTPDKQAAHEDEARVADALAVVADAQQVLAATEEPALEAALGAPEPAPAQPAAQLEAAPAAPAVAAPEPRLVQVEVAAPPAPEPPVATATATVTGASTAKAAPAAAAAGAAGKTQQAAKAGGGRGRGGKKRGGKGRQ